MAKVYWYTHDVLTENVKSKLLTTDILLDVGCGIMPQQFIIPKVHICCEPFKEYVAKLQEKISHFEDRFTTVVNVDWETVCKIFPPKSIDTVILVDVLEHLEKTEGEKLIKLTEQIARQQIIIFTPLGFFPQSHPNGLDAWGLNGAAQQEHKSGWYPEDFDESWEVLGAKEYHFFDNLQRKLDKPFGAFWAIKTIPLANTPSDYKIQMNQLIENAYKLNSKSVLKLTSEIFKILNLVKSKIFKR